MEVARIVEVFARQGSSPDASWSVGSGFIVRPGVVLTASHVLGTADVAAGDKVQVRDAFCHPSTVTEVLARDTPLDVVVLAVPELGFTGDCVRLGRVKRDQIGDIELVHTAGFPGFKQVADVDAHVRHELYQAKGHLSVTDNIGSGTLVMQSHEPPPALLPHDESPWHGFSGSVVYCDEGDVLIGVVIEHYGPEGVSSLTVRPISDVLDKAENGTAFATALGCACGDLVRVAPKPAEPQRPPPPPAHGNLPARWENDLVDRGTDIKEVRSQLAEHRLVTLIGVVGCGKSRLALEVGATLLDEFKHGVWYIDAVRVVGREAILRKLLALVGDREHRGRQSVDSLIDALQAKQALLLLDNCDDVRAPLAGLLKDVLDACPGVRFLITSREALRIPHETQIWVSPLVAPKKPPPPIPWETLQQYDSVQLFIARAQCVDRSFTLNNATGAAVAALCTNLAGIPLAIEVAAAHIKSVPPNDLEASLSDHILSWASPDPHHRSLDATIDWSYARLPADEKTVFRRVSVFTNGFTREAAQAACADQTLSANDVASHLSVLVEKSLVVATRYDAQLRYSMYEPIRRYAADRLEENAINTPAAGECDAIRANHARYYLDLARRSRLTGRQQAEWYGKLETEHDNILSALGFWEATGDLDRTVSMCLALSRFWFVCGYWQDSQDHLDALIHRPDLPHEGDAWAKLCLQRGAVAHRLGDYETASKMYDLSEAAYQQLRDKFALASILANRATLALDRGHWASAEKLYRRSLHMRRALHDLWGQASPIRGLGLVARACGDLPKAQAFFEASLELYDRCEDTAGVAGLHVLQGTVAWQQGNYETARTAFTSGRTENEQLGARRNLASALQGLALVDAQENKITSARDGFEQSLKLFEEIGDRAGSASAWRGLAQLARREGNESKAAELLRKSEELGYQHETAPAFQNTEPDLTGCMLPPDIETIEVEFRPAA